MAWNDQLGLVEKWTTGPAAFAHSRAGVRWIAALVATSLIFFLGVQVYHKGAYTYPSDLGLHHILPVGSATSPQQQRPVTDGAGGTRSPAWIDTPPAFDVSRLPAHSVSTASLDRDPALPPRLAEAMAAFLARPVLGHEEAEAQNEAACPPDQLDRQVNADQLRDSREGWLAVDEAQITGMRQGALEFLEARARDVGEAGMLGPGVFYNSVEKMVPIEKGSRGVVIAAGNHRTVERAVVCVREMQRLGWKGAVEVWHFEGELTDEADREILTGLGVAIHMVSGADCVCGMLWRALHVRLLLCADRILRAGLCQEIPGPVEELRAESRGYPPQLVRRGALPGLGQFPAVGRHASVRRAAVYRSAGRPDGVLARSESRPPGQRHTPGAGHPVPQRVGARQRAGLDRQERQRRLEPGRAVSCTVHADGGRLLV